MIEAIPWSSRSTAEMNISNHDLIHIDVRNMIELHTSHTSHKLYVTSLLCRLIF